jgi:hypothetical protein
MRDGGGFIDLMGYSTEEMPVLELRPAQAAGNAAG